jgi:hypothetical protein
MSLAWNDEAEWASTAGRETGAVRSEACEPHHTGSARCLLTLRRRWLIGFTKPFQPHDAADSRSPEGHGRFRLVFHLKGENFMWRSLIAGAALACSISPLHAMCEAPRRLTGEWKANDGGTYWIRQVGNQVWWVGTSSDGGRTFTNTFRGTRDGAEITGEFADVPRGQILGSGQLNLRLILGSTGSIRGIEKLSGPFGAARWFKPCRDT